MTRSAEHAEAWTRYHANHPEVLAVWGEQNGRAPNCTCDRCDLQQLLPRPNILADAPCPDPSSTVLPSSN